MSNKERIIQLLDQVPPYKMGYILAYVQGILAGDDIPPKTNDTNLQINEGGTLCH